MIKRIETVLVSAEYRGANDDCKRMTLLRKEAGASYRQLSKHFNIPVNTIFRRLQNYKQGFEGGKKLSTRYLTACEEADLAESIRNLAIGHHCFTIPEVMDEVGSHQQTVLMLT